MSQNNTWRAKVVQDTLILGSARAAACRSRRLAANSRPIRRTIWRLARAPIIAREARALPRLSAFSSCAF